MILWEDTIQQELQRKGQYSGEMVTMQVTRHGGMYAEVNTREQGDTHIRRATRRSPYFAHTKTGKQQAVRPTVNVKRDWMV